MRHTLAPRTRPLRLAPRRAPAPPPRAVEPYGPGTTYQGAYGPWSLTPDDVKEVTAYRLSLAAAAAGFAAAVAMPDMPAPLATAATLAVGAGLTASSTLIHVYVTEIKRTFTVLAVLGAVGAAAVAATHPGLSVPAAVQADANTIWLVGPAAAAATGIAIKEGLCYGKLESAALAALLPAACLTHLSHGAFGLAPPGTDHALAVAAAALAALFAARKFSQPVVEDLGDKSVFEFRALTPVARAERLEALARRAAFGGDE